MTTTACGGENRELRLGAASGGDYEEVSVMYERCLCMCNVQQLVYYISLVCMSVNIKKYMHTCECLCVSVPHHAENSRKARPLADDAERKRNTQTSRAVMRLVQSN